MGASGAGSGDFVFLLVGIGVLFLTTAFVVGLTIRVKRIARQRLAEVQTQLGDQIKILDPSANFFGQKSLGIGQVRGNGVLALTEEDIYFLMWLPRRELRIPRSSIQEIKTPRSFLGKSKLTPLLEIVYTCPQKGKPESAAWLTSQLQALKLALEKS